jgi:hypothetical protein
MIPDWMFLLPIAILTVSNIVRAVMYDTNRKKRP